MHTAEWFKVPLPNSERMNEPSLGDIYHILRHVSCFLAAEATLTTSGPIFS